MVERLALDQKVVGSSPTLPSTNRLLYDSVCHSFEMVNKRFQVDLLVQTLPNNTGRISCKRKTPLRRT